METDGITQQIHVLLRDHTRRAHYLKELRRATGGCAEREDVLQPEPKPSRESTRQEDQRAQASPGQRYARAPYGDRDRRIGTGLGRRQAVLDDVAASHPSVAQVWIDGAHNSTTFRHGARPGIDVEVVKRLSNTGLQSLPKRWAVEQAFCWLMQHRRLARDYEAHLNGSARWPSGPRQVMRALAG